MRTAITLLGTALLFGTGLLAQVAPRVVISEINFSQQPGSTENQWIELYNRNATPIDIGTWSIYQATKTAGLPGTYWWPFPAGTVIPGYSFLRIHWREAVPVTAPPAGQLFSGATRAYFLFGYGAEAISTASGALALLNTQQNAAMNTAGAVESWVSWGDNGFAREDLAIQNQRWTAGAAAPSVTGTDSLALALELVNLPTPVNAWFRDATPTPGTFNAPQSSFPSPFGNGTRRNVTQLLQVPELRATLSPAAPGNRDQVLSVDGTQGLPGETVFLLFSLASLPGPVRVERLDVWIDPGQIVLDMPGVAGQLGTTNLFDFTLIPNTVPGLSFFAQAVLFNTTTLDILGATNGIQFTMSQN